MAFLEEAFGASSSRPQYRVHEQAARRVLKALLPEKSTEIKGLMRPYRELRVTSGYAGRESDFADLIRVLRSELRLIMPAEPGAGISVGESARSGDTGPREDGCYQLTHDYLVPSLRKWLTRRQRETRQGRAALLLEDRVALWSARPERRFLPTFLEWLQIMALVRPQDRTSEQARMMSTASRLHIKRILLAAAVVLVLAVSASAVLARIGQERQVAAANSLADRLLVAGMDHVPALVKELEAMSVRWRPRLAAIARDPTASVPQRTRACLALVREDPAGVPFLLDRLLEADPREHEVIRAALEPWKDQTLEPVWSVANDTEATSAKRLRAACALARFDLDPERWKAIAPDVAKSLVSGNLLDLSAWSRLLEPGRQWLREPLRRIFQDQAPEHASEWMAATSLLSEMGNDEPDLLIELAKDANDRQYQILFPALNKNRARSSLAMRKELALQAPETAAGKEQVARRKVHAAITLLRLGEPEVVWPVLGASPDPRVRALLIDQVMQFGVEAGVLEARLAEERDPIVRQAILVMLGDLPRGA